MLVCAAVALTFAASTAFRQDVEARIAAYFDSTGFQRRGCIRMLLKTATIFMWLAASYLALVFLATTCAEQGNAKAGNDAGVFADICTEDDVTAGR